MIRSFISRVKKKVCSLARKSYRRVRYMYDTFRTNPDFKYAFKKICMFDPERQPDADIGKRADVLDEYRLLSKENGLDTSQSYVTDSYYDLEISPNTILMIGLGKNVRGNLQYVLNELNSNDDYRDFTIYVRTDSETDEIVKQYIRQNNWQRTHTVLSDRQYQQLTESANYLLAETFFPEGWVKKPGQVYINIWHGTPLKKLGLAKNTRSRHKSGAVQKNFIDADYLLYPNEYTRAKMLASYKISQLLYGKTFLLGYPRTGGMIEESRNHPEVTRQLLAPNGEKIYAYMPTFRDYLEMDESVEQSKELLDYMEEHLGSDQLLYVNIHHRLNDFIDYSAYTKVKKFPPTVDSYRLLSASDALISDYSSVFIDYPALRKQIVLYIPDYEIYRKKRGLYTDLLAFPFDKAETCEEVLSALNRGKQYDDTEIYEKFCSHDSTENARKLCRLFLGKTDGLELESIPKNEKRRALIYTEAAQAEDSTNLLFNFIKLYRRRQSEVYLSCDRERTNEDRDRAYPLLYSAPVIGTSGHYYSALGKAVKELYSEAKIDFSKAIECLKYDYAVTLLRWYGRAQFDLVVIYDVTDPETILSLAQSRAEKILFLQHRMIEQILSGDTFLRDAVCYTAGFCRGIFVLTSEDKENTAQILGEPWQDKISVIITPRQFERAVFPKDRS